VKLLIFAAQGRWMETSPLWVSVTTLWPSQEQRQRHFRVGWSVSSCQWNGTSSSYCSNTWFQSISTAFEYGPAFACCLLL
jgi:hypothetical protein